MEMVMKPIETNVFVCEMIGMSMDNKGKILVIMELMESDLQNLINSCHEPLNYGKQMWIMETIVVGIKELHKCGLIHIDFKVSNIHVSPHWEPLLLPTRINNEDGEYGLTFSLIKLK